MFIIFKDFVRRLEIMTGIDLKFRIEIDFLDLITCK